MRNGKTNQYIRTIARTRNISAAAEELGISQPALSAFLKKTEEKLGAPIFDRSTTPLSLTEAGTLYLEFESDVQSLERELLKKISDAEELLSGELVVGGAASFNMSYLPKAVAEFTARFPGIRVRIVDGTVPYIAQAATEGNVDVFLAPDPHESILFNSEKLLDEKVLLCVPATWPETKSLPTSGQGRYATIDQAGFELLRERAFVILGENQHIGKMMRKLFDLYDMHPEHVIEARQTLTSLALTLQGAGISLAAEKTLEMIGLDERLAIYLPDERICLRSLYVVTPSNRYVSRAASEFIAILRNTLS